MEMFVALDVAIGLSFMYLMLAIVCTAINEWIAGAFRLRAQTLKTAVSRLVDADPAPSPKRVSDPGRLSGQILEHPLIRSMKDGRRGPSYIPAARFVAALKDTMDRATANKDDIANVNNQLAALRKTMPQRDDDERFEEWFNDAMDRASGWYRRKVMWMTVTVSAILTVLANADTISAARVLWQNPTVRAAVVAQAQERARRPRPAETGVFVQADYPDKDRPISDASPGELEEDNPEDANVAGEEEEPAADDSGITEAERMALAQIVGWGREFREINRKVCQERQRRINEACIGGATTSEACTRAIDEGTAGGLCRHGPDGLEATDAFPRGEGVLPLTADHFFGWLLTAAAVSLGAPFWFDTLKLFMSVRGAGKRPDEEKPRKAYMS